MYPFWANGGALGLVGSRTKYGIKTGYNAAFVIDSETYDSVVAANPQAGPLLRPYLRGRHVERWLPESPESWLIVMKSSDDHPWPWAHAEDEEEAEEVFRATYPALHSHFQTHEERLRRRSDRGRFWWELRTCDYYEVFENPKILYQEIQFHPSYALDRERAFPNNKCFAIPSDDLYLLAVLNSPLMWWYNWRNLPHMKDEALTPVGFRMDELPIAEPTGEQKAKISAGVSELIEIEQRRQNAVDGLHDWLLIEFGVEKPGQKLSTPHEIGSDTFVAEVKKRRAGKSNVMSAELLRLRDEFENVTDPLRRDAERALELETQVSDAVNQAYGITLEEVELMWRTAPPRMPRVKEPLR